MCMKGKRLGRPKAAVDAAKIAVLRAEEHSDTKSPKTGASTPHNGRLVACSKTYELWISLTECAVISKIRLIVLRRQAFEQVP
jgi:hypothetical protein